MHGAAPDPRLIHIYQRAQICRTFSAYKLHELRDTPAVELLLAVQLIHTAQKALA